MLTVEELRQRALDRANFSDVTAIDSHGRVSSRGQLSYVTGSLDDIIMGFRNALEAGWTHANLQIEESYGSHCIEIILSRPATPGEHEAYTDWLATRNADKTTARERKERKELARLKSKYEGGEDVS